MRLAPEHCATRSYLLEFRSRAPYVGAATPPMDLYIMRHGIAEDVSSSGLDRDRQLTTEGIEKTKATAAALRSLGIEFDLILASPYARAHKTAEIVSEKVSCKSFKTFEALASGGATGKLIDELQRALSAKNSVLLVGHEPDLSRLISVLISGNPDLRITMKKGGFCKLHLTTIAPAHATFEWLLTPKHFQQM